MCPVCEAQKEGEDQRGSTVGAATTDTGSRSASVVVTVEIFMFANRPEPVETKVNANQDVC